MKQILNDNWFLICSKDINDYGETISRPGYVYDTWYPTSIPNTVVAALVDNKIYDDPYFGLNLLKIPGYKKDRNINFSLQYKPEDSPFRKSWWYRT
ncbi:MAG: glycosyl hydrolase family 2, partial [Actinobacteria bacterium]